MTSVKWQRYCYIKILFIIASLSFPMQASAVINAEDSLLHMNQEGLAGNLGLSINGNSGNSAKSNADIDSKLIWRHGVHTDMLMASFNQGQSRGKRNINKSYIHIRHRYALDQSWDIEVFGQAQKNEFSLLQLRTLVGAGMRWSLQKENRWALHLGLGSFYEREQLKITHAPITTLWRMNSYLSLHYILNEKIQFRNTLYYQPAWKDTADIRLLDDATCNIVITDRMNLKLSLQVSHDSRPPIGVLATDTYYKTGLEIHF
ncbi:MAG: DUF481 domain-containing protein [Mariprofundaceae bacterium]|nr:DUF481 domain-containing protein [Mariprofundaceae bacterium]